jgi:hypothetical protein
MFKTSMKIIQAKLFRSPRSADPKGAGKNQVKGVHMLSRRFSKFLAAVALAIAFVACAGISGGSEAKAQGFSRNYYRGRQWDRRHHQRERYQWRRYRQHDRWNYRRYNRFDRYRYNNRFGRYPYRRW